MPRGCFASGTFLHQLLCSSVGNEFLEFKVESRVVDNESLVKPSHFVQTPRVKSSLFLLWLESTRVFLTFIASVNLELLVVLQK